MRISNCCFFSLVFLALLTAGCTSLQNDMVLKLQNHVIYECENGNRVDAQYYALPDNSFSAVRITLPDGTQHTLPRVISASGARFSDDFQVVWWTKGNNAFMESRNDQGEWEIQFRCHAIKERNH